MAQAGYTPIQLYYSPTTTNVPLAANLAAGELAINTFDGKLFYKDSSGVVRVIASAAGTILNTVAAATASATIANGNNPIAWNWTQTTASQNGFAIGETTASTGGSGSQVLLKIGTLAASTADPLQVQARGQDTIRVSYTGAVALTGASGGTTGTGANINITSGAGGSTSGDSGAIDIRSGTTTSGASGSVTILASSGTGTSATGDINIAQANSRATTNGIRITAASAFVTPSAAGSPIVLTAGNGSTLTTGGVGGAVTITSGNGGLAAAGGNLNLTAGNNASSGVGGKVVIRGGGSSATQVSNSGGVEITGGVGNAASVAGGNIAMTGGQGSNITTGGAGGAVDIFGGFGRLAAGVGGAVTIQGGVSEQNLGGAVNIYGGASSTPSTSPSGGSITIRSGSNGYATSDISIYSGNGSSGGTTGAITLTTGTLTSGAGRSGDITLQQGDSGATPANGIRILGANARAGSAGVAGGPIVLTAGSGSTTTTGALGGDITITAGAGGLALAGGAATLKAGNGGATGAGGGVAITAGNGNSAAGGDITLTTGTGSTQGAINFVNTNVANGAVATTLTSVGPTGAATTVQGWLAIKVGGTARYIPFW